MNHFIKSAMAVVALAGAIGTFPTKAHANQTTGCTIYDIQFYSGLDATHPEPLLGMNCLNDPISYRAYYGTNPEGCSSLSIDQVKTFLNLLTAAHIAGKLVNIVWTANVCGQTTIDAIQIAPTS